ncbi:Dipeptide transport system permease protein DppB [Pirellulimonas nuda]|uniref:Dipeptide transport system permease protein DppB n=1 Tax=Pirellulimonas nuda TaxID=2528009 RepID=A0A518DI93_9BACT|nr:ABC transporter permease [Pirellulimonas nuda]QDU91203.1 Dipeptide transport system permease protein DppB [Pirellulimonas nuda]
MALVLVTVFVLSFLLMHFVPGGAFQSERKLPAAVEANFKRKYNLDKPLPEQAWLQATGYLRGDFGVSMKKDFLISTLIRQGLPVSAALGTLALLFAFSVGLTAGIISAVARGGPIDVGVMTLATIGIALPNFVIAGFAILLFVFTIPLLPAAGWGSLRQLVLPAVCLGAPYAAYVARIARTGMLDALSQDCIRTARAKGLSEPAVVLRHALPTALLPVVSFLGPAVAGVLTGSPVIEKIFAVPGLGWHFVQSALDRDLTVAMGLVLLYTFILYSANLLVDIAYRLLDPRVELS